MRFVDGSVKLFAVGSVAFGAWGLIHPKSLTGLLGDDPELGRLLGARDLVVGLALFKSGGPLPLAMRLASDLPRRDSPAETKPCGRAWRGGHRDVGSGSPCRELGVAAPRTRAGVPK